VKRLSLRDRFDSRMVRFLTLEKGSSSLWSGDGILRLLMRVKIVSLRHQMPLRAIRDDLNVIPPLNNEEWEKLKERIRARLTELRLPCCQGLAYPRVSPRGVQHFVHYTNSGCPPESELHLLAKRDIRDACLQLGFEAIPEYDGDGWRADVLVRSPKWKCCFEVQLSPQSFEETLRRQEVYRRHNLRCCWLFLNPPERHCLRPEYSSLLSPNAIPMFRLLRPNTRHDSSLGVEVNGVSRPLHQFVRDLLTRRLRYARSQAINGITTVVKLWKTYCPRCGYRMHFFNLEDLQGQTECGANISVVQNRSSWLYPVSYGAFFDFYITGIPAEVREFLRVENRPGLPFCEFACPGCGQARLSQKPPSSMRTICITCLEFGTESEQCPEIQLNHWCDSPLCRKASRDSAGEILDTLSSRNLRWKCTAIRSEQRKIDYRQHLPYRQFASYAVRS
jgi:hypothetical protein